MCLFIFFNKLSCKKIAFIIKLLMVEQGKICDYQLIAKYLREKTADFLWSTLYFAQYTNVCFG